MEKELEGKKIIRAEIRKSKKSDSIYFDSYSEEEIKEWDDKPILELEMDDGTIFLVEATYGGYTGGSYDEYPSFIQVKKRTCGGTEKIK